MYPIVKFRMLLKKQHPILSLARKGLFNFGQSFFILAGVGWWVFHGLKLLPLKRHYKSALLLKANRLLKITVKNIECLPYQDFIGRYDRADSLFYLAPPYWNNENDYGKGIFSKADFDELAKLLKKIKGKFIMSINDVPEIRKIFKAFYIREVQITYTTGTQPGKQAKELLISNVNFDTL